MPSKGLDDDSPPGFALHLERPFPELRNAVCFTGSGRATGRRAHLPQERATHALPHSWAQFSLGAPGAPRGSACTHLSWVLSPLYPRPFQRKRSGGRRTRLPDFPVSEGFSRWLQHCPEERCHPGQLWGCSPASPSTRVAAPASDSSARCTLHLIDPNVPNNQLWSLEATPTAFIRLRNIYSLKELRGMEDDSFHRRSYVPVYVQGAGAAELTNQ